MAMSGVSRVELNIFNHNWFSVKILAVPVPLYLSGLRVLGGHGGVISVQAEMSESGGDLYQYLGFTGRY